MICECFFAEERYSEAYSFLQPIITKENNVPAQIHFNYGVCLFKKNSIRQSMDQFFLL